MQSEAVHAHCNAPAVRGQTWPVLRVDSVLGDFTSCARSIQAQHDLARFCCAWHVELFRGVCANSRTPLATPEQWCASNVPHSCFDVTLVFQVPFKGPRNPPRGCAHNASTAIHIPVPPRIVPGRNAPTVHLRRRGQHCAHYQDAAGLRPRAARPRPSASARRSGGTGFGSGEHWEHSMLVGDRLRWRLS